MCVGFFTVNIWWLCCGGRGFKLNKCRKFYQFICIYATVSGNFLSLFRVPWVIAFLLLFRSTSCYSLSMSSWSVLWVGKFHVMPRRIYLNYLQFRFNIWTLQVAYQVIFSSLLLSGSVTKFLYVVLLLNLTWLRIALNYHSLHAELYKKLCRI